MEALGLIAGQGALPLALARSAREAGRPVVAVALRGLADPALVEAAAEVTWIAPGEVAAGLAALRAAGVREAVMAGKVQKRGLLQGAGALAPDAEAAGLLAGLGDLRDDSILGAIAARLEREGVRLLPQAELAPGLVGGAGPQGAVAPSPEQLSDATFGFRVAKATAGFDVGQTVVVKGGVVLAVEALEGTDAAIRRGGQLAPGATVVKVAKPGQDPRFDVPAVGPDTLAAMLEAGARALAYEAGGTLLLERAGMVAAADAAGVALFGLAAEEPA